MCVKSSLVRGVSFEINCRRKEKPKLIPQSNLEGEQNDLDLFGCQ